jgi:hypothetical protein
MKRHLGRFLSIATLFAVSLLGAAMPCRAAQVNLQFELVGPFAVCEEDDKHLRIWIPKLDGNHFVPSFRAGSTELPLGDAAHPKKYPTFDASSPGTLYGMKLTRSDGTAIKGLMAIMPPPISGAGTDRIAMYGEVGPFSCAIDKVDKKIASISIVVPKPDEVWPDAPAAETELVSSGGTPKGQCSDGCRYATRVTLRYTDIDLTTSKIVDVVSMAAWTADAHAVGSEARITLEVVPVPDKHGNASKQSERAFKRMTRMVGNPRDLRHVSGSDFAVAEDSNRGMNHRHAGAADFVLYSGTTAKDCHAPVMLVCSLTPAACQ